MAAALEHLGREGKLLAARIEEGFAANDGRRQALRLAPAARPPDVRVRDREAKGLDAKFQRQTLEVFESTLAIFEEHLRNLERKGAR